MSGCSEIVESLEAYALKFLPDGEREAVGAHLQICPSCAGELEKVRATLALLEELPTRRPMSRTAAPRARFPWAAAAGWLLAVGLGALAIRPVPPDPRVAALETRLEAQAAVIGDLRQDLVRRAREREAMAEKLDRQGELLRSIEDRGRRDAEEIRRGMKIQEEQIRSIGEGLAALVRRTAETSEQLRTLRQVEVPRPATPEPPKAEPVAKAESPPADPAPNRSPVDAAQGFLLSVFRDRGGSLNQKIRAYKDDLNRTYENR
jgi:hypothetical protein